MRTTNPVTPKIFLLLATLLLAALLAETVAFAQTPKAEAPKAQTPKAEAPKAQGSGTEGVDAPETFDPSSVESDAEHADELYAEGLRALAAGDAANAVEILEKALAHAPNDLLIGTDYRQAVIALAESADPRSEDAKAPYDRALAFFARLVEAHPNAANAYLNYAFAHVDKVPAEGAITQVILANDSLGKFGKAIEIEESWLALYSRGHAYLFWPPIFGRVEAGIADLERAVALARENGDKKHYYARAWAALGDGFWRQDNVDRARDIWKQGLAAYPDDPELLARWNRSERAELDAYLNAHYDSTERVGTHLREIYGDRLPTLEAREKPNAEAERVDAGGASR